MLMIQLMVNVPRVTGTHDPKAVESGMTRGHLIFIIASHPIYLNPYDNVAQGSGE